MRPPLHLISCSDRGRGVLSQFAGTAIRTGAGAFGTRANTVPPRMIHTPSQIHMTERIQMRFQNSDAHCPGSAPHRPVEIFTSVERMNGIVDVCWLAL